MNFLLIDVEMWMNQDKVVPIKKMEQMDESDVELDLILNKYFFELKFPHECIIKILHTPVGVVRCPYFTLDE